MFVDIVKAVLFAGIPVGAFSFLMVYYAYLNNYLSTDVAFKHAFKKNNEAQTKLSKKHKKSLLFLHSKWVTFGGGFYGLIALLTFVVIELLQIVNFLMSIRSFQEITALFSVNALISMFVDSVVNMLKAAIWFTYWPDVIHAQNFLVWIIIAYLGYQLGARLAKYYVVKGRCKAEI
mgnify:CR=1 FL=1